MCYGVRECGRTYITSNFITHNFTYQNRMYNYYFFHNRNLHTIFDSDTYHLLPEFLFLPISVFLGGFGGVVYFVLLVHEILFLRTSSINIDLVCEKSNNIIIIINRGRTKRNLFELVNGMWHSDENNEKKNNY